MSFYLHDNTIDSPINNFATLNSLVNEGGYANILEGNLRVNGSLNGGSLGCLPATMAIPKTGKWYWEVHVGSGGNEVQLGIYDIGNIDFNNLSGIYPKYPVNMSGTNNCYMYYFWNGSMYVRGGGPISFGSAYNSGNLIGFLVDSDNLKLLVYRDGVYQNEWTVADSEYVPMVMWRESNGRSDLYLNFGQDALFSGATNLPSGTGANTPDNGIGVFAYMPVDSSGNPITDFKALCTKNIPSGPINVHNDDVPSDYMKTVTYTGQTVGGAMKSWDGTTGTVDVGFQPDLVWIKRRTGSGASNHSLIDSIRGATYGLHSDTTQEQWTDTTTLTALNPNGFSLGTHSVVNGSGNYVAWCFRSAGRPVNDGDAKIINEDGTQADTTCAALASAAGASITPAKVSANRKSGFSIIKYQGASNTNEVPHGLSQAPELIIIKNLNYASGWVVGSEYLSSWGYILDLSASNGEFTASASFNSTAPASNVFSLGSSTGANNSSYNYIAYCWHSVSGFSKFGSYVGNGSADGPYVECGFRVGWLMVKRTDVGNGWEIHDNARDPYNPSGDYLIANESSYSFGSISLIDFLSSGFKIRTNVNSTNNGSGTYIYAAFAESPFNAPATAR